MKTTIEVELQPFIVPDYVIQKMGEDLRQCGLLGTPKFMLSELAAETLEKLCEQFTDSVFTKAGKNRPCLVKESIKGV